MEYKESLRIATKYYPRLFISEEDYLHQLFFVNGNGYKWIDGELFYETEEDSKVHYDKFVKDSKEKDKEMREFMKGIENKINTKFKEALYNNSYYGKTPEETKEKEIKYRKDTMGFSDTYFMLPDGRIGRKMYPICEYAKILHVPDNVKPDWLDAAFRAVEMAESDLFRCTDKDIKWLEKAKKKLSKFEKKE